MKAAWRIKGLMLACCMGVTGVAGTFSAAQAAEPLPSLGSPISTVRSLLSQRKPQDESPLNAVWSQLQPPGRVTAIKVRADADWQTLRAPEGVIPQEWRALQNTLTPQFLDTVPSEHGDFLAELRDLDDDGVRDLVLDSYTGGTGLFSETHVAQLLPDAARFAFQDGAGYSINGRGSDQDTSWVFVNGKTYLAYRDGDYWGDSVSLTRVLDPTPRAQPALLLRYAYTHQIAEPTQPAAPDDQPALAQQAWRAAHPKLIQAIRQKLAALARMEPLSPEHTRFKRDALCSDERSPLRGPGHYTFDTVFDFSVRDAGQCYEVSLIAFRSSYMPTPLSAVLWIYQGAQDATGADQVAQLPLHTRRTLRRITLLAQPTPIFHGEK